VVLEALILGVVLGSLFGLLWWAVTPSVEWLVTPEGVSQTGSSPWFAADGWFLVLGALFGVLFTVVAWRRHRAHPLLVVVGVVVGTALLAVTGRAVGAWAGPVQPESLVAAAPDGGVVVEGALEVTATGVLFAPTVAALTLLLLFLAAATPGTAGEATVVDSPPLLTPPQSA
jgi:hypothetical protein